MDLLRDPFLWLVSFGFLVALGSKTAIVDWGQLFLMEERMRSQLDASAFTSSVETGGFVGRIAAGYVTDYFVKRQLYSFDTRRSASNIRVFVAVIFLLGSVLLTHVLQVMITDATPTVWLVALGFILGICLFGPIAIYGISASESAPPHLSGSAHAVAALAGNVGAMLSGFPCCYVAKHHSWSTVLLLLQVLMTIMLCMTLWCRNLQPKYVTLKKKD